MRLKGGKVLLDLTSYGDLNDGNYVHHLLTDEEVKSIKDKGLLIKILLGGNKICFEPLLKKAVDTYILFYELSSGSDEVITITLYLTTNYLDIETL